MRYEINVSFMGSHFFATSERSLTSAARAKSVYDKLKSVFPKSDGYDITITRIVTTGETLDPEKL